MRDEPKVGLATSERHALRETKQPCMFLRREGEARSRDTTPGMRALRNPPGGRGRGRGRGNKPRPCFNLKVGGLHKRHSS